MHFLVSKARSPTSPKTVFALLTLRHAVTEEVVAENGRPLKQQLAGLRFFDLRQDCPTNAGILVLADRPMHYLPGAYVQFVRYAGPDLANEVLDEKRALGDLRTLLQTLNLIVDANLRRRPVAVAGGFVETMVHDYPRVALHELLLNAVIHRNYQSTAPIRFYCFPDHLTLDNPGGLHGEATADFPARRATATPSLPRPPVFLVIRTALDRVSPAQPKRSNSMETHPPNTGSMHTASRSRFVVELRRNHAFHYSVAQFRQSPES